MEQAVPLAVPADADDLVAWIHRWETMVFGAPAAGFVYRESVEQRYVMKSFDRPLHSLTEAVDILHRLANGYIRVVVSPRELTLLSGNLGENGGHFGVGLTAPENTVGTLRLRDEFATPMDVATWLDELSQVLFGRPCNLRPPTTAAYDAPISVSLQGLVRNRNSNNDGWGLGRCSFDSTSATGDRSFYVNIDHFESAARPLLLPQVFQQPTVTTPAELRDYLAPIAAELLGAKPEWHIPDRPLPQALTAAVNIRDGHFTVDVGDISTRWVIADRDLAPLFEPRLHQRCQAQNAVELAAWLWDIAGICFAEEPTWSTNWAGQTSPVNIYGTTAEAAAQLFELGSSVTASVKGVDSELLKICIDVPKRHHTLAGWSGILEPPLRGV